MTDSTKQLFDAPWKLYEYRDDYDHWFQVLTNGGRLIASRIVNKEDYNRLVRLPELYDALVETTYAKCYSCHIQKEQKPTTKNRSDYIENGCTFHKDNCYFQKVWELLRKVRDGE